MSSTEQHPEPAKPSMGSQVSHIAKCLSPPLPQELSASTRIDKGFVTHSLMILPLALHFLGSLAVAAALLYYLNGRQFYLERPLHVRLADGTLQPQQLGQYSLLQPEVTTILSAWLMVLRWVAAMWAVPLCWRAIFVLAGNHGVRYQDISWATNYGIFYPSTHFKHRLNLLLGLILILTLAPQPSAPLLTGSISWLPSNRTVDLPDHPTITIAGYPENPNFSPSAPISPSEEAAVKVATVKNFNTAWTQVVEPYIFKRVLPLAAHLSVGSTVDSVLLPYFLVTRIEWLSGFNTSLRYFDNFDTARLPQSVLLLSTPLEAGVAQTWTIAINVGTGVPPQGAGHDYCNSKTTVLPANSTIPTFLIDLSKYTDRNQTGCFAFANVSIDAGHGLCSNCRVSSYSTIQNDTELQKMPYYEVVGLSFTSMDHLLSLMSPLRAYLPDPTLGLEVYITALLGRIYSAAWNSWADATSSEFRATTGYKPLVPMLRAEINRARVYAWLCSQLLLTLAGVTFIGLQLRSQYPLVGDTDMLAFDIDSTEVSKPSASRKNKTQELLQVEPKGDGWKVIVAK